jgi:hypothetical protein
MPRVAGITSDPGGGRRPRQSWVARFVPMDLLLRAEFALFWPLSMPQVVHLAAAQLTWWAHAVALLP